MARVMRSISSPPVIPLAQVMGDSNNSSTHKETPNKLSHSCRGSEDTDEPLTPLFPEPSTSFKDSMTSESSTKLSKRESYKAQRKNYRREKKRVARELLSTLKDPSVIILADWLKVRGSLKGWTKLWCVLKPGLLILYKTPKTHKSSHWVGTVLLNSCELIERPSKKDGFCFKLFHPMEQSIWASRGPKGETRGALVQPLPVAHLIFRAPSESAGKCWMDAAELVLKCSSLLIRSTSGREAPHTSCLETQTQWNESDLEKHFNEHDLEDGNHTDDNREGCLSTHTTDTDSEVHNDEDDEPLESPYAENEKEEFGQAGDAGQTEEVAEENKSLIWTLVKQVRPGMDLSKVVLPTFILEPRSFLDKLTDYYYHADILSAAVLECDPFTRMKMVVQWYLSGFYKKPKGLKKPYNPILGETFRCFWNHPATGSRTFYVGEQVSHHPPISTFYVTNRMDGFCISGSILAKSKFYGNSLSAILDGTARLTFLSRGEDYTLTMPYAHCKGILLGTLTMELGGKVEIVCEKTGYRTEMEFKLRPFLGGSELSNIVQGKIKLGKETLATIHGHWDGEIILTDKRTEEENIIWNPSPEMRAKRLRRFTVPIDYQEEFESERMWQHVAAAIHKGDQVSATEEKTILEEAQRRALKEREAKLEKWLPRHFVQDLITGEWVYKHADLRPWDKRTDTLQYESNFVVQTKTRHKTPAVRTHSILSIEFMDSASTAKLDHRPRLGHAFEGSESSSPDVTTTHASFSGENDHDILKPCCSQQNFERALGPLVNLQKETNETMKNHLELLLRQQQQIQRQLTNRRELTLIVVVILAQILIHIFL